MLHMDLMRCEAEGASRKTLSMEILECFVWLQMGLSTTGGCRKWSREAMFEDQVPEVHAYTAILWPS